MCIGKLGRAIAETWLMVEVHDCVVEGASEERTRIRSAVKVLVYCPNGSRSSPSSTFESGIALR